MRTPPFPAVKTPHALQQTIDLEAWLNRRGFGQICGVDEVGRGPLAGPVVAAACILPADCTVTGLDDSKKLTPAQRTAVFEQLVHLEIPFSIGLLDHEAIDRINILKASLLAMRKAVSGLTTSPRVVLVDGNHTIPNLDIPQYAVVRGDARCRSIAAASIIAKVTRDRIMDHFAEIYPHFSFSGHKGYPTPAHLAELKAHGPTEIHRRSFRPVADCLAELTADTPA